MQILTPNHWYDYELIDTGNFEKLERFGKYVLARPEPQAIWDKKLPEKEWQRLADAIFSRAKGTDKATEKGEWTLKPTMPQQWWISYKYESMKLRFRLGLTSFKHVGVFPEQAENWNFIYENIQKIQTQTSQQAKILNLFAYTGGASLAARAAGGEVTHIDSVKQVVSWSRENMEGSGLDDIRWVVEDAFKFVKREVKRGKKYNGIILDPPAYGRGPEGEKWILEDQLNELLKMSAELLAPNHRFFVLNLYSMGFSGLIAESLLETIFQKTPNLAVGEFYFSDNSDRKLPLGIFARFTDV